MPTLKWHDWSPSECYTYMFYVHVSTSQTFHSPLSGQGVPTSTQVLATCNSWNSLKRHYQERKKNPTCNIRAKPLEFVQAMDKMFGQLTSGPPPPLQNWFRKPMMKVLYRTIYSVNTHGQNANPYLITIQMLHVSTSTSIPLSQVKM